MPSPPLVSIVVPSWQKGRFLRAALDSLLAQTYPHVEILVQDNGSTDETAAILDAYAPRLAHAAREEDAGQSDALCRGYARSRGAILGWLNADDLLMPDALERVVAAFQAAPALDVVYGHCALLSADGQFLRYFHEIQPFSAATLRNRINFIPQPSTFFRCAAYERVGGLDRDLHYAMDWDLWCRLAAAGCRFQMLDAVLSGARHYAGTKTGGGGLERQAELLRVNRRHKTTRVPVAAAAHLYADVLRPRLGGLHPLARRLWRAVARRRYHEPAVIRGMAFPDRIHATPVRLRFPWFGPVHAAHLVCAYDGPTPPFTRLEAHLNGQPGAVAHTAGAARVDWRFARPRCAEAVDITLDLGGFAPGAAVRLREVLLHPAPIDIRRGLG